MGASTSKAPKPKVVIVGAAAGGKHAYDLLRSEFDVTLVDGKEFFEFTPSALRCIVEPEHAAKVLVPHASTTLVGIVDGVKLHQGGTAGGSVTLQDGRQLPFDYLLLCTGTTYAPLIAPAPAGKGQGTIAARKASFKAAHDQLKKASSVLIVGGGSVGVELAAEIAGTFGKEKQVTLVSSSSRVLERLPAEASAAAEKWLKDNGVKLLLGDRVENLQEAVSATANGSVVTVQTRRGQSLQADLIYSCIGGKPNTGLLAGLGLESSGWQPGKAIPVEPTLQVRGLPNFVFAAGDCAGSPEEKTALAASLSGALAGLNIKNLAAGKALLRFPQDMCHGLEAVPMVQNVSLHRKDGVMVMGSKVTTGASTASMKGMVEWFVVHDAKGTFGVHALWSWMGKMNMKQICTAK